MNRRILAATMGVAALATTLTACKPSPATSASPAEGATATAQTSLNADPACTVEYGPNQAGIYATGHKVDASVYLKCNGTPDNVQVSLTLAYVAPGTSPSDDQAAATADYQNAQAAYTTSAGCKPGDYALHVFWGANVNGAALGDQTWGKTATVTAADCARS